MIVCRILGPVDVSVDGAGAPAELLWRKNLALLVYLARSPKRARAREHLIGLLWGDKPEAAARHSLNEAVRVLRRHTGEDGVESNANQVKLAAGVVELDAERLEGLAAEGNWAAASELISGEFLEGFSVPGTSEFDDWLTAERSLWRMRSVEVLLRRTDQLLAAGGVAPAHDVAQRALDLEPCSDAPVRAVMRCLALAGDRAGALERFEAFATRLRVQVGTAPDPETQALAERVRRERAWRVPVQARPGEATGAESRRAPLVGRAAELESLLEAWAACCRERRPSVAIIEGDAGTGKTRLAEELMARARLDGAAVAAVRAVEADAQDSWSGVLGIARGGLLEAPGVAGAPPPALTALRGLGAQQAESPGRALSEALRAVAEEQPLLVLVDDAQWLDRESLLALGAATRDVAGASAFLLVTAATQPARAELDALRVRIGRELAGVVVRLEPLPGEALRALARWALPAYGDVELDRVTRRVAADSAGIPLLAVELLHAVAVGFGLHESQGAWPQPFRTLDQTLPGDLPDAVVAAMRIGFRRVSAHAQRVLAAAAVLGGRVAPAQLGRATGLDDEALAAALDELEWQRWLTAEPRGYAFVARVVRDMVERDMVTQGQRERILQAASQTPG
ncbi:MAG TPA: AAA family ATPase [Gemmatimonadales bacterium]|nr:AAA family ATPase [Gemmatimonadales bacterium]